MTRSENGRTRGLALALAAAGVLAAARAEGQRQGQGPGAAGARSEVRALARLEPEAGAVVVGARPGAKVVQVLAVEGRDVKEGDLLALLEGHDQRRQQFALAESQKAAALFKRQLRRDELALERETFDRLKQTRLDTLRGLVRTLKDQAGAAGADDAKPEGEEPKKAAAPLGGGMVPPEVREAARAQMRSELAKAEVQLKELEVSLELLARKRALEDRPLADDAPELAVLDHQVALARADLAATEVRAPAAGRILAVLAHAGEVSSGPLLTMGDLSVMVARAEVFQTDAPAVSVGDPAEVAILGRAVAGEVTRVGTLVGRNTIQSLDPTALADRRVVEVVVRLADPALASRLVNMQAEVAIRPRRPAAR